MKRTERSQNAQVPSNRTTPCPAGAAGATRCRRYGKNARTPNRNVRGQPIERTGVRATS